MKTGETMRSGLFVAAVLVWAPVATAGLLVSENFDSMGTSTTGRPAGWTHWSLAGSNSTFTDSVPITGSAIAGATQSTGSMTVFTQNVITPSNGSNDNDGTNVGFSSSPNDRAIGTAGTSVAATMVQYSLTNTTGAVLTNLIMSYSTEVVTVRTAANELPGYFVFYSTTGTAGPWTAASELNTVVSNTDPIGMVYLTTGSIDLSATPVAAGGSLLLRWVDDNADQSSPDALYGIDNVAIVPEPAALGLLAVPAMLLGRRRRA